MPWPKPKKNPATNNSNREILDRLDRIIELLEHPDRRQLSQQEMAEAIINRMSELTAQQINRTVNVADFLTKEKLQALLIGHSQTTNGKTPESTTDSHQPSQQTTS